MELFAMAASVTRAHALVRTGMREGREAVELADVFCRGARRRVAASFRALWSNDFDGSQCASPAIAQQPARVKNRVGGPWWGSRPRRRVIAQPVKGAGRRAGRKARRHRLTVP
jgi:hypothetical protein